MPNDHDDCENKGDNVCYSSSKKGSSRHDLNDIVEGAYETPGRPVREDSSGRDVGCLVVLETGTCVCCQNSGSLDEVDVWALSRLLLALHGFSHR